MRGRFQKLVVTSLLALATAAAPAQALPRAASELLPLSAIDEQRLLATLGADRFEAALALLARGVHADSANTPASTQQVFYSAPYFSPDPQVGVIGEQTIDVDALALLDAFDMLLTQLAVSPILLSRLEVVAREYDKAIQRVKLSLGPSTTSRETQPTATLRNVNRWANEARVLSDKLTQNLVALPDEERKKLGVELSSIGRRAAVKSQTSTLVAPDDLLAFLTEIRAALASRTYGVRHATFIAGFTEAEAELLSAYLDVRPDITLKALPVPQLFVSAVSESSSQVGILDDRVLGVELIRSVNRASNGKCEKQKMCTVVLEFTELGARTALLSIFGASLMPVIFSGDVVYSDTSPLTPAGGPQAPSLDVQEVARDTGLSDVLLDRVQTAPMVSSTRTLELSASALLETSQIVSRVRLSSAPLARTVAPIRTIDKRTPSATRVFFDGVPLVCFAGQANKPWYTELRACTDPLLQIGTQVSRYEEVVDRYCGDTRLQPCLERVVALPFEQAPGSVLELPRKAR